MWTSPGSRFTLASEIISIDLPGICRFIDGPRPKIAIATYPDSPSTGGVGCLRAELDFF